MNWFRRIDRFVYIGIGVFWITGYWLQQGCAGTDGNDTGPDGNEERQPVLPSQAHSETVPFIADTAEGMNDGRVELTKTEDTASPQVQYPKDATFFSHPTDASTIIGPAVDSRVTFTPDATIDSSQMGERSDSATDLDVASQRPSGPIYVMPLGDSITATGCWRARLWDRLQENGYDTIDFVGSQVDQNGGCNSPDYDRDHEGHSGTCLSDISDGMIASWFSQYTPDIVLMHYGTNDVWGGRATQEIMAGHIRFLEGLRRANPEAILLIALIIPVAPPGCADCPQRTVELNEAVKTWAAEVTTPSSPVVTVDQHTGFYPAEDTEDGVHPYRESGTVKIANNWYDALIAAL